MLHELSLGGKDLGKTCMERDLGLQGRSQLGRAGKDPG